jgi:acetyltransferase-like isoleucine patch superfamily enzyme
MQTMRGTTLGSTLRIAWTIVTLVGVEMAVCALAVAPVVAVGMWLSTSVHPCGAWQVLCVSLGVVPGYTVFALALTVVTPAAVWITGWRTPAAAEMRIRDLGWPLLGWVRFLSILHVTRFFAGGLLRGTPIWTMHLRLCGARMGRRVYINSLDVSDYNLLDFGDDVVIGGAAHVSGHTVEGGVVKTGTVKLGRGVTIGLASIVEIGVEIAPGCQIGAMSFVPKHARLDEPGVYVGIPAARLTSPAATDPQDDPVGRSGHAGSDGR